MGKRDDFRPACRPDRWRQISEDRSVPGILHRKERESARISPLKYLLREKHMERKKTSLLLCALLCALFFSLIPAAADGGEILDGRWLCSDVQGFVTEDTPAELKDDFALYVNKPWILQAEIPAITSSITPLVDNTLLVKERQAALMKDDSLTGHDADLVHKFYNLMTDWDTRNALGTQPVMLYIDAINAVDSLDSLTELLYSKYNLLHLLPITVNVDPDPTDPDIYVAEIDHQMLMLGPASEYTERTDYGDELYQETHQIAMYMLQATGYSAEEAEAVYDNALAYETKLAACIPAPLARSDPRYYESKINYFTPEELTALAGNFPITDMLASIGMAGAKRYNVVQPDYIAGIQEVFTEENVPLIRDWLIVNTLSNVTRFLDKKTIDGTAEIYGNTGIEISEDLVVLTDLEDLLPVPLDNLYIQKYCTEKMRQDVLAIVNDVIPYYRTMLESVDWLSEETRNAAIEKLDAIDVKAVYPDETEDWSGLDFAGPEEGGSLLEAYSAITDFRLSLKAARIDTPVDKKAWDQKLNPASSVGAMYTPDNNSINIFAGILNGEFYNEGMSYEQMLGGIGFTIGHEISHAFDTNGSQYDKDGAVSNWWTEEDSAAYRLRVDKLAAWYDGFIPFEGAEYHGEDVQTEVCSDMASMKCMLAIAAEKEDFDYDAFFRQFAANWRDQSTLASLESKIRFDSHPMHYMRINATLAQFDEFLNFYGITEGDGMYIAPEDRVAVW